MTAVKWLDTDNEVGMPVRLGASLLELFQENGAPIRSGCSGIGGCGLCRVRIHNGKAQAPTEAERSRLSEVELSMGMRLACQVHPEEDLIVSIVNTPIASAWRRLDEEERTQARHLTNCLSESDKHFNARAGLGIAIDLGTTCIKLTLLDGKSHKHLCGRSGGNPQGMLGADVMTRLEFAHASEKNARLLTDMIREAIGIAIGEMLNETGRPSSDIADLVFVGNTAMLTLLAGTAYTRLLQPEFWSLPWEAPLMLPPECLAAWGIAPDARAKIMPPLAGFVGSDLMSGMAAIQLTSRPAGTLLIDFGTNSEMALWDGHVVWVASAAGGPAFEGVGLSCGMPAEPGAIYRYELPSTRDNMPFSTIDNHPPVGVCGSGYVDMIACLVKAGMLNRVGKFDKTRVTSQGFAASESPPMFLLERDIDLFQRAKGAIGAGIGCLMRKAGLCEAQLQHVFVGGAFGQRLNVQHAQAIGLLPAIAPEKIMLCGNTALAGCEELLFSSDQAGFLESLYCPSKIINMAQDPDFEHLFFKNLYLQPMQLG